MSSVNRNENIPAILMGQEEPRVEANVVALRIHRLISIACRKNILNAVEI